MKTDSLREQLRRTSRRDLWMTIVPAVLLIIVAFAITLHFIKPAPPRSLVLALAPEDGGQRYFARQYQEFLARYDITLTLRTTQGSAANMALLIQGHEEADIGFLLGGTVEAKNAPGVVSLGGLSYLPLWVFYRGEPIDDVRALRGRRVAVGATESGTAEIARTLLKRNGVDQEPTQMLPLERDEAIEQLEQGRIDALFIVAPSESPRILRLAAAPGVRLMSFARADAYVRAYPPLSKVVLPRGLLDFARDLPGQDVVLLAITSNLMARDTLHPALAYLLLRAASEIHGGNGMLEHPGEFPAPRVSGFPLAEEARRYYQSGVPLLQRYLPFWAANLVDRLWVMLVPILGVLLPLGRLLPSIYLWRIRSRITRWYASLKEIEIQLEENPDRTLLEDMLQRLDTAEHSVNRISVPLSYAENLYFFREHIDVVRRRILRRLAEVTGGTKAPEVQPST